MRRISRTLVPLALVSVVLVGCGRDGSLSGGDLSGKKFENERGKRSVTVEAVDNNFVPHYITVSKGTTVTFINKGHNRHNVIWVGDTFKASALLDPDDSVKVTLEEAGDYAYYCSLHGTPTSRMTGGIRVVG